MILRLVEASLVPILVASIGAWAVVRAGRRQTDRAIERNTAEHDHNKALLNHLSTQVGGIDRKVDRLDTRLDEVAIWQAEHEKAHLTERQP